LKNISEVIRIEEANYIVEFASNKPELYIKIAEAQIKLERLSSVLDTLNEGVGFLKEETYGA